ncbi:chemotaxis protein CheC [Pseudoduganella sp. GCM10020061]|uniref:chemotaxis protein CheC n=1 Tax=Pseudoduganella sp. GCM10020061 TaxID=3317345 RepID=UPI00363B237B
MHALSELQQDALLEIFNIGIGHAAAALSDIVNEKVTMAVPSLSFLEFAGVPALLGVGDEVRACGISQQFRGAFETSAVLMFPEHKSLELVRLMLGESTPLAELSAMEQEALTEIGNILLNACIGALADIFEHELRGSMPRYHAGRSDEVLAAACGNTAETHVLLLHIDFALERHQIDGYVAFVLDMGALGKLRTHIDGYLQRMGVA